MGTFKIRIRYSTIILVMCLIGYMKPAYVAIVPFVDSIFNAFRVVSVIVLILYVFFYRIKISVATKLLISFYIIYVLTTWVQDGDIRQAVINAVTVSGEILLFEIAAKKDFLKFVKIVCRILSVYVLINTITVFFVQNSVLKTDLGTPIYFLGIHNRFIFWMLPLICFSCIYAYMTKKHLSIYQYGIHLLCLLTLLYKNAVGAAIGLVLFYIFFIFISNRKIRIADYRIYILLYFVLWILLTFTDSIQGFSWIINGAMGKEASVGARLSLWERGINYWTNDVFHFLFGYGIELEQVIVNKFWYVHLHNNLLNVIYQTGLIGMIVYSSSFLSVIYNMIRYKYNNVSKVVSFSIFTFLIMLLMDTYDLYGHFYTLLVIAANLQYIIDKNE